jgi:hypothetical protein
MSGWRTGLVAGALALLALPAPAQELKLVPQTVGLGAFDTAGWSPDGRWLLTASGYERRLRIWDPATGVLVDSVVLPLPGRRADERLVVDALTVSADGRRATIEAVLVAENEAIGDTQYKPIAFSVDLLARRAAIVPTALDLEDPARRVPGEGEVPAIDAGLPLLPPAPDGRRLVRAEGPALRILDAGGTEMVRLTGEKPVSTDWVAMSPDGALAVFMSPGDTADEAALLADPDSEVGEAGTPVTRFTLFDIESGSYAPPELVPGRFGRLGWLSARRIVVSEESSPYGRDRQSYPAHRGTPTEARVIDLARDDGDPIIVAPRCYLQPLGAARLVGAGLANCRHEAGDDRAIWVAEVGGEWRRLPVEVPRGATVDGLRASPDGTLIALSFGRKGTAISLLLVDAATGAEVDRLDVGGPMLTAFEFLPDSRSLVVMGSRAAVHWRFAEDRVEPLPATDFDPSMMASNGETLLFGGAMSPLVQRVALDGGAALAPLDGIGPVAGGWLPAQRLFWVGTADGELKLFDGRDQAQVATLQRFRDERGEYFLVRDPEGRYDGNLPPDYAPFRWLVMDAPFQSLAPQTFMRELYTPDLMARLMACTPRGDCQAALPVALDVSRLNRTLPSVALDVRARPDGKVDVVATVTEGVNERPSGAYDKARSGMHNLRLFRDGALVAEAGAADPGLDPADRAGWRAATGLRPTEASGAHVARFEGLAVPSGAHAGPLLFSAYAFNEDRVRGPEAEAEVALPATAPRPRRLFLLSIGVDAYPGGLFRPLRYAVADARAMAGLFAEAFVADDGDRPLALVPIRVEGTAAAPATRAAIAGAFARLKDATPDDMVVVSFSGHGYTDARGRFALVPSDVASAGDVPVRASLIGADDLARWLTPVDAGAIHFIIDACHSAASVEASGFKPGPMGDPGLGQLAYDKGIRILSASASDQFAMEDSALGHGLLTYALVEEGARQGKADSDGDALVTLDELMAYAVTRLPSMADPTDPADGPGLVVEWAGPQPARQTPRLFDFASDWSPLAVRSGLAEPRAAMARGTARP